MGQCFLHGNGGASKLKFDVMCQTAEPEKKQWRIWIKSSVPMTMFNTHRAWGGASVGAVVIDGILRTSHVASDDPLIMFVDTKMRGISVSVGAKPSVCYQVQGSKSNWVTMDAYVCENNTWVQFSWAKRYLIQNGAANVDFVASAAYLSSKYTSYVPMAPTIAGKGSDGYYRIYQSGSQGVLKAGVVTTSSLISMGHYTKLCVTAKTGASSGYPQSLCLWRTTKPSYAEDESAALVNLPTDGQGEQTKTISLTGISSDLYVGFLNFCYGATYSIWIKDLWLE